MILLINTAKRDTFVGLADEGKLIKSKIWEAGFRQSEELLPNIEKLVGKNKISGVVVATGPGSYTGLRVGVATANALGFGWGVPVVGVDRFSMLEVRSEEQEVRILENIHDLIYAFLGDREWKAEDIYFVGTIEELCDRVKVQNYFVGEISKGEEKIIKKKLDGKVLGIIRKSDFDKDVLDNFVKISFERLEKIKGGNIVEPLYIRPPNITKPKSAY